MTDLAKQHFFTALDFLDRGDLTEAARFFRAALGIVPSHGPSLANLASILVHQGSFEEGCEKAEHAVAVGPPNVDVLNTLGFALRRLYRDGEALKIADQALEIDPASIDAQLNRANALRKLNRFDESLSAFDFILSVDQQNENALLGRAAALAQARRFDEATALYEMLLSENPDLATAWLGLGDTLVSKKSYDHAVEAFDRAIAISPKLAEAWASRGGAFVAMRDFEQSLRCFGKAISLNPRWAVLRGDRFGCAALLCDWKHWEDDVREMKAQIEEGECHFGPANILYALDDPELHLKAARLYTEKTFPCVSVGLTHGSGPRGGKIRLGYFSSDFRQHATSILIARLFELHDRSKFEVIGFFVGAEASGEMTDHVRSLFDNCFDIGPRMTTEDAVRVVCDQQIDIAIDLNGYLQDPRPDVFAARIAPIQVSYLGYPGTMGATFMDYIVVDKIVASPAQRASFAEHLAYLPNCYQANDTTARTIPNGAVFRTEHGLPDKGCVFCCFNNNNKINPEIFSDWMTILRRVPGSVLWLLKNGDVVAANLRREASARGIDPDRIVFAPRVELPLHLARHRLADLFLDTLPYNAHTTASDALWAGVPVLTRQGEAFAGRVATSILTALNLQDDLVTLLREEYIERAVDLANDVDRLDGLRKKLADNVKTSSLFDVKRFTADLESLYEAMYRRHVSGLQPAELCVGS